MLDTKTQPTFVYECATVYENKFMMNQTINCLVNQRTNAVRAVRSTTVTIVSLTEHREDNKTNRK